MAACTWGGEGGSFLRVLQHASLLPLMGSTWSLLEALRKGS